jgi:hypothetical protein
METYQSIAITVIAGAIAIVGMICVTVLLLNGTKVPSEFWGVIGSTSGAAVLGGAVTQGASISKSK